MHNSITIVGKITSDITSNVTGTGKTVAKFSALTSPKNAKNPLYLQVVAWEKTAEFVSKYFEKGKSIVITGELQSETWKDKKTNQDRSSIVLRAERVSFAGEPQSSGSLSATGKNDIPEDEEDRDLIPF